VFSVRQWPLVAILREALLGTSQARKRVWAQIKKNEAMIAVRHHSKVHNFGDECLVILKSRHRACSIIYEAQPAWNLQQTANFMLRRKNTPISNYLNQNSLSHASIAIQIGQ